MDPHTRYLCGCPDAYFDVQNECITASLEFAEFVDTQEGRDLETEVLRDGEVLELSTPVGNNLRRKALYAWVIATFYGKLGKGVRMRNPPCVLAYVEDLFPRPAGAVAMGHMNN